MDVEDIRAAAAVRKAAEERKANSTEPPGLTLLATTADGGRIFENAQGKRFFTSPSYATNDPDSIAQIMEGASLAKVLHSGFNESIIAENPLAARAIKFVEGTPFLGSYLDEGMEAVLGEDAGAAVRLTSRAMEEERPGESMALNLAGGINGAAGMGAAALKLAGGITGAAGMGAAALPKVARLRKGSPVIRAALATIAAAGAGATEGAIYGAGLQEGGRARNAERGALFGGALGGAFFGGGSLVASGVEQLARRLKKVDTKVIQNEFGLSKPGAQAVKAALDGEDLDAARRSLTGLGDEAMLADAGPAAGAMLDAVAQTGGAALRKTRNAVESRATRAQGKLKTAFDLAFGKPKGTREAIKDIAQSSAGARQQAYTKAFETPINYANQAGQNIEAVLERIPARTLKSAINEANEEMQADGFRNMQIMAEIADDGAVTFREMPNVLQVHQIKRALQSIGQNETDEITGQVTSKGRRAKKLAQSLRSALEQAVPAYKTATRLGGDKIAEQEAFMLGQRIFQPKTTLEDIADLMDGATPATKAAAKDGIRNFLETSLDHVRQTITDGNVEARQAMAAVKMFSSDANRKKLIAMVGKDNAKRVFESLDQASLALELRAMVATNSKTAARAALQREVSNLAEPGIIGTAARGEFGGVFKQIVQVLTGASQEVTEAKKRALYSEIAGALTKRHGPDAERALGMVQAAMEGQVLKDEEAAAIARLVTQPVAVSGDQAGREMFAR